MIRIAINGYGRIGRNILRAHYEGGKKNGIEIVAINDLGPVETNAHLLRYDSVHGRFPGTVTTGEDWIDIGRGKIKVTVIKPTGVMVSAIDVKRQLRLLETRRGAYTGKEPGDGRAPRVHERETIARERRRDEPANGESLTALRTNIDRHLVGSTTDAARTDFDARLHVVERVVEDLQRLLLEPGLDGFESAIDDAFGDGLLAVEHDAVHELGEHDIAELGIGQDFALLGAAAAGHLL